MQNTIKEKTVTMLGRTCLYEEICWCGLSGSGISFEFTGRKLSIVLAGDDSTTDNVTEGFARVGIYVNGARIVDTMLKEPEQTIDIFDRKAEQTAQIRVIKLSECTMSTMGIKEILTDGSIAPVPEREHKIEFIGDSITCGYGVDLEDPETDFHTDTEDVTKAYAYKTAQKLQADYSIVSYSGYGICSGYTEGDEPFLHQRVPAYYESVGFSYARPQGKLYLSQVSWDFHQFEPQLIVLNLGTNDNAYCRGIKERESLYETEYIKFLKLIRKNNKKAKILCVLGIMGEQLCPAVATSVRIYKEETGDFNVDTFFFKEQEEGDGRVTAYQDRKSVV